MNSFLNAGQIGMIIMDVKESCQKLAGWIFLQIDRHANPLKYETPEERIERYRREDKEHELRLAQMNQKHNVIVREEKFQNTIEAYQDKYPNSEFNAWNGDCDGFSKRRGKGRKPWL